MSSTSPGQGRRVCWNCETAAQSVIDIIIRVMPDRRLALSLCQSCYISICLPLIGQADGLALEQPATRSVLVVDDEPAILKLVSAMLSGEGFAVETAANGQEALTKLHDHVPDAIVLDLRMPVMSGREFLTMWRQTAPDPRIPVIAISAHEPQATAEELGVQAFLPKPFAMSALVNTVDRLLAAPGIQPPIGAT
jgi:CheY-like chemotaxis protein